MFVFLFLKKEKIKSNTQKNLLVALDNHRSIWTLRYPRCRSCPAHVNLLWKDHKPLDNLFYLSNLFSAKHRKQILVKHSIKKGEGLEDSFPLWNALRFLECLMKYRCFPVPTRMVAQDQIDPRLISETWHVHAFYRNRLPSLLLNERN